MLRYIKCKEAGRWIKIEANKEFEQLVTDYKNLIFSICLKMTGDYFAAEDLTQETFLSAYQHMDQFQGEQWKAWLCRIASNLCIDYRRQAARRMIPTEDEVFQEQVSPTEGPLEHFLNEETMEELQSRCDQMKPPYNEIASLYYCKGKTADEIAAQQNKSKKTIQTQIYRARDMLRAEYRKERGRLEVV